MCDSDSSPNLWGILMRIISQCFLSPTCTHMCVMCNQCVCVCVQQRTLWTECLMTAAWVFFIICAGFNIFVYIRADLWQLSSISRQQRLFISVYGGDLCSWMCVHIRVLTLRRSHTPLVEGNRGRRKGYKQGWMGIVWEKGALQGPINSLNYGRPCSFSLWQSRRFLSCQGNTAAAAVADSSLNSARPCPSQGEIYCM